MATHNGNNAIDFSDGGTSTYTATLNAVPDPDQWYCATCHDLHLSEDPAVTTTHTFYDSLAFPNSKNSVDGAIEPTGDCTAAGCHDGTAGRNWPPDSEEHPTHVTTYGYSCTQCHPQDHDATVEVDFAGNFVAGGSIDGNLVCSNTYCHGDTATPDWDAGVAGVACDSCHGSAGDTDGTPDIPGSGGRHKSTTHDGELCTVCHANTDTDTANHAHGPANTPRGDAEIGDAAEQRELHLRGIDELRHDGLRVHAGDLREHGNRLSRHGGVGSGGRLQLLSRFGGQRVLARRRGRGHGGRAPGAHHGADG